MKVRFGRLRGVVAGWVMLCSAAFAGSDDAMRVTTTLLPNDAPAALWVRNPDHQAALRFGFDDLPRGLHRDQLERCTLRVVAAQVAYREQQEAVASQVLIKVRQAGDERSLASLRRLDKKKRQTIALNDAGNSLCDAIFAAYDGNRRLNLELFTQTDDGSTLLYGADAEPSLKPRLVLEYRRPEPGLPASLAWHQHQHDPQHSGRGRWQPFRAPSGFRLDTLALPPINGRVGTLPAYPLIWHGRVVVIHAIEGDNHLAVLDPSGRMLWSTPVARGRVQTTPVISPDGVLTLITENMLASYDLERRGEPVASRPLADDFKLDANTSLTVADDGSLLLAVVDTDVSRVLGYTPILVPFVASGTLAIGGDHASTPSLGRHGRLLTLQTSAGAVRIDLRDPRPATLIELGTAVVEPANQHFFPPVAGPRLGELAYADYVAESVDDGGLWLTRWTPPAGFDAAPTPTEVLQAAGHSRLSQPVLGGDGRLRYLHDERMCVTDFDPVRPAGRNDGCVGAPSATSNPVLDGADNLYYWAAGELVGLAADGKPLFPPLSCAGPGEQYLRLALDPGGTLWSANSNGTRLLALRPTYDGDDLTLAANDIRHRTAYRTAGRLSVGAARLNAGNQVLLQAGRGVAFAPGFRVERGAELLVRTGLDGPNPTCGAQHERDVQ